MTEKTFAVTGMTCSACSSGIERTVGKLEGVTHVEVSLMGKSMRVTFDEQKLEEKAIFQAVNGLGYGIFQEGSEPKEKEGRKDKKMLIRLILSLVLWVPLIYVSMGSMVGAPVPWFLDMKQGYGHWNNLYQAVLALAIIIINFAFFKNGFLALIKRVPNMDTLVMLGSGISFLYSVVLTVLVFIGKYNGNMAWYEMHMDVHFESAATILTLVTVGKYLEEKSKRRTGDEIEKLLKLAPDTVTVEVDGVQKVISVKEVQKGDVLIVRQGEYIPVDGVIVEGSSFVDKSAITGESLPVEVTVGDMVTSAALNKSGVIKMKAERVGSETTLSKIVKMVKEAGASKAPIQKLADKIAGIFVPVVCLLALLTFLIWIIIDLSQGNGFVSSHSVTFAISVLVVSCPCALGLATPVAIMTATGKGASLGILYKDAENLQKLSEVNAVLLDKTATLTEGKPKVTDVVSFQFDKALALSIAGGIERNSNHPLANCIVNYVEQFAEVSDFNYQVGKGASAKYNGQTYLLGNEKLMGELLKNDVRKQAKELSKQGKTVLYLADEKRVVALIAVADTLKEGSVEAVSLLKQRGMRVAMLTGDESLAAKAIAESVGIDDYVAEVMPEDKLQAVINTQKVGGCVAMVGDGINDSPALKQADVGIAMGSGTDVAIDSAGVVLVSEDIRTLDTVFDLSKATLRNIKQNLFWAFFYNVIMIPVAAGVFYGVGFTFTPSIAAACMSLSSLFVVGNALRLLRYKNKKLANQHQPLTENLSDEGENNRNSSATTSGEDKENDMKTIVNIEGMCCEHCAKRVEGALTAVHNVVSADVKLKKNLAVLRSREELSKEEIQKAVEDAGYKVTSIEVK